MPEQEQQFELNSKDVGLAAFGGVSAGLLVGTAYASGEQSQRSGYDDQIDDLNGQLTTLKDLQHDFALTEQDQTKGGQLLAEVITEKSRKVDALVAERPDVHAGRDVAMSVGGLMLVAALANVAVQYHHHRKAVKAQRASNKPATA